MNLIQHITSYLTAHKGAEAILYRLGGDGDLMLRLERPVDGAPLTDDGEPAPLATTVRLNWGLDDPNIADERFRHVAAQQDKVLAEAGLP